jgi:hypothetical protein
LKKLQKIIFPPLHPAADVLFATLTNHHSHLK